MREFTILIISFILSGCSLSSSGHQRMICEKNISNIDDIPAKILISLDYQAEDDYITRSIISIQYDFSSEEAQSKLEAVSLNSEDKVIQFLLNHSNVYTDFDAKPNVVVHNMIYTLIQIKESPPRMKGFFGKISAKEDSLNQAYDTFINDFKLFENCIISLHS